MNTHAGKHSENKNQSIAHAGIQNHQNSTSPFQFVDKRPEALAQKNLQDMANQSPRALQLKALQEMADNSPLANQTAQLKSVANKETIQLFKGAVGTNQSGANIPFTLAGEFTGKHVAANEAGAIANTQARLDNAADIGRAGIIAGTIGNTVATNAVWTAAINGNADVIPENFTAPTAEDIVDPTYTAAEFDDTGYSGNSSYMQINAWEVTYEDDELTAEQKTVNRRVAGTYHVTNLNARIDINHCTQ